LTALRRFAWVCCVLLLGAAAARAAAPAPAPPQPPQVNFGVSDNVIELKPSLTPYHAPGGPEADGSVWYMLSVTNDQVRPAIRVLIAGQPPRVALSPMPRPMRPAILAVASSDSGVLVQPADAYGHRAWRVIIPPVTSVGLAVRVGAAQAPPSLLAWTEPALAAHNRQLAIFITAVATLIAAGALITGGLAVLIGHAAPRWSALTLFLLLWSWLAGTGMFDASLATHIGGPYGLTALLTALALAAGARLADAIVPLSDFLPRHESLFRRSLYGLSGLGALAYLGVPGATVLTDAAIVAGSAAVALYLFLCGRAGVKAAQVIAPSAAAFALVALAAAVTAAGGLGEGLTASATTGGFAAAGAILLALAVIASEEIAVLPFLHGSGAARLLEAQVRAQDQSAEAAAPLSSLPFANLALAAIGAAHQGVFDLDFRSQLVTLSPEASRMLGLGAHEATLSHADWVNRLHPEDREDYRHTLERHLGASGTPFQLEFRTRVDARDYRWLELRGTIVTDRDEASGCLGLLADITQRKALPPAIQDPLTGLATRAALSDRLAELGPDVDKAVLALLDLDRFKQIHANLGDSGGDLVLAETARRLTDNLSGEAELFRTGGDEFALLATAGSRPPQALGDAVVELCAPPHFYEGRTIFAPGSVGVAADAADAAALLRNAQTALGAAKRRGGGHAQLYRSALEAEAPTDSVALESDLRHALENGQLEVFYQPIMRLSNRTVAGFEALLRWRHPQKGLISPADFIAHSEESGLIVALGGFALERAAGDLAHWQKYFPVTPPLFVSVNLSRRQLRDRAFETLLARVLKTGEIAPGTLRLEVTESAVEADGHLPAMLSRIRTAGAGLSIDDFGTGASSLSRLRNLPFDTVKIDKSFLGRQPGADGHADAGVVLSSIVALAHDLRRAVVVEGVETAGDEEQLRVLGCEFGQGYHFAPALAAAEALAFIAKHYDVGSA
jgi:diguanylate cyclase (GGDEF)-like protein/PAS domain S-box-containing protein